MASLRRTVVLAQIAVAAAVPAAQLAAMSVGVFLFVVDFLMLVLLFDVVLLLQVRALTRARPVGRAGRAPPADRPAPAVLEQADRCFVSYVWAEAAVSGAGYMFFLVALDLWARARYAGGDGGTALIGGAVVAVAIIAAGRWGARASAWREFAGRHPSLWQSEAGLRRGRTAGSAASYLDWRRAVEAGEGSR